MPLYLAGFNSRMVIAQPSGGLNTLQFVFNISALLVFRHKRSLVYRSCIVCRLLEQNEGQMFSGQEFNESVFLYMKWDCKCDRERKHLGQNRVCDNSELKLSAFQPGFKLFTGLKRTFSFCWGSFEFRQIPICMLINHWMEGKQILLVHNEAVWESSEV